ncbi:hypothetical protein LX32DRAFT_329513 [Colletotrichum zoysiae]|uniref:Uncharacterized protein n=1 Tax=Colletotrichum zoysiae TaxID=1216348 RepID=A0AAD9M1B2_9PEZI|nr:hypothetical protein LX32DRAFT_329513 [Colletotrichum zoysiae]
MHRVRDLRSRTRQPVWRDTVNGARYETRYARVDCQSGSTCNGNWWKCPKERICRGPTFGRKEQLLNGAHDVGRRFVHVMNPQFTARRAARALNRSRRHDLCRRLHHDSQAPQLSRLPCGLSRRVAPEGCREMDTFIVLTADFDSQTRIMRLESKSTVLDSVSEGQGRASVTHSNVPASVMRQHHADDRLG